MHYIMPVLVLAALLLASPLSLAVPALAVESGPVALGSGRSTLRAVTYASSVEGEATVASAAAVLGVNAGKLKVPQDGQVLVADQEYVVTCGEGTTAAQVESIVRDIKRSRGRVLEVAKEEGAPWLGVSFQVPKGKERKAKLLKQLVDNERVASVEPNFIISLSPSIKAQLAEVEAAAVTPQAVQSPAPSWGLDRIDGVYGNGYNYVSTGTGVCVYILDTGVKTGHPDFGSRRVSGAYIPYPTDNANQMDDDFMGHGTHVAGTAAGTTYGVAKAATVISVRVMDNSGSGTNANIALGVNWIVKDTRCTKKVINMSIGGSRSSTIDSAVAAAVSAGILVVVAAGNEGVDACTTSPAAVPSALTVGATGTPVSGQDPRAAFGNWGSNYGSCVDVFAPGVNIVSDHWDLHTVTMSGTSMATPHVTGLAARVWSSGACSSASTCSSLIINNAKANTISNAGTGSPNRFAFLAA